MWINGHFSADIWFWPKAVVPHSVHFWFWKAAVHKIRWLPKVGNRVEACTAVGSRGLHGACGESAGTVTERTGNPWYRVTNCTGSPRGGGMPRSHTACSARTASASLQRPSLCSLHYSIPSTYPPSVKCELSTDQATAHTSPHSTPLGTVLIGPMHQMLQVI